MLPDLGADCFSTSTVVCVALVSFLAGTACVHIIASVIPSTPKNRSSHRLPSFCENDNDNNNCDRDEKEDEHFENCIEESSFENCEEELVDKEDKKEDKRIVSLERAEQAAEAALTAVDKFTLGKEKVVPKFEYEQLDIGNFLGKGKMSDIYEVIGINRKNQSHKNDDIDKIERRYAVKYLDQTIMSDRARLNSGAIELAVETKLLSSTSHPNIINIHGVSGCGLAGFSAGTVGCYFLLLDRLDSTLEEKIYRCWKRKQMELRKRRTGTFNKVFTHTPKDDKKGERREFFIHRLGVALDIASALEHLHSLNVVYRDLQPGNIGFDFQGNVKLFNLGLARELRPDKRHNGKLCKIKGSVGHIRYMAPEMALGRPYNLLADVYSFTILLWEIISIEKPFEGMTKYRHSLLVLKNSDRPPIDLSLSFRLRSLLKTGWSKRTSERPKMTSVCKDLEKEIQKRLSDSNRSTTSSMVSSRRPSFGSSQASLLEEELNSSLELDVLNGSSESFLSHRDGRIEHFMTDL